MPIPLGSDSWFGIDQLGSGQLDSSQLDPDEREFAVATLAAINWESLLTIASNLRTASCTFTESFTMGQSNMVRRIQFSDGISWVARVRITQPNKYIPTGRELLSFADVVGIEVASMRFLKAKTSIPVPEVHYYNTDPENEVGAPYILMDYIHGTTADKLSHAKCDPDMYGTPDQDRRFREQMAEIQVTISTFKFDKIGSLHYDETTSEFFIGPELETGKGPWNSPMEYYNDLADHVLQVCEKNASSKLRESPSFENPNLFKHLMSLYSSSNKGPFSLVDRDFGANNLLVDDEFRIIGVIDFDGVMAAPIEVIAQFPSLTGLDRQIPRHIETSSISKECIKPKLEEYKEMIHSAESKLGSGVIADLLLSDATYVYYGLNAYKCHQACVNDSFMVAYQNLLRDHEK
ncbi:hypothetical protein FPSE_06897 [Fusarium pseudograminearum CS3096]|uniref:Aminoglycoside phosphotransferase domain-containing protein n=2 Tax=Fusarium pseudograminearum TaxID=101028 RepID=K3ULE1_FUSPC|nr:hypothetical protein FPSE_06897 [Fusarium pseudograminearum CS3096]EKJ72851.1 hypothetical protein FPSE_06897 [Fusarium pseudograminearum CS3096]KAF0643246.1 hypothetical protein FPSE5266_06897 [Fusarium pseudograminearum]